MCFRDLAAIPLGLDGLHIRAPHINDVPALTDALGNFDVTSMLASVPFPCPAEAVAGWVEIALARRAIGNGLQFVISDASDVGGPALGSVGFSSFGDRAELGFWLSLSVHGKGIMTAAVRAALHCAFDHGATTIVSGAFIDNPASLQLQKKLGFDSVGERCVYSLSRRQKLAHIDTRLERRQFVETA
ncbi:MAG: GNAT family N-acetyltransferase [Hyphomicrobiales bacterium]